MSILCLNSLFWVTGPILIHCNTAHISDTTGIDFTRKLWLRIPQLYSPTRASIFKWTPCGGFYFLLSDAACSYCLPCVLDDPSLRTPVKFFVTAWSKKSIWDLSHIRLSVFFFFSFSFLSLSFTPPFFWAWEPGALTVLESGQREGERRRGKEIKTEEGCQRKKDYDWEIIYGPFPFGGGDWDWTYMFQYLSTRALQCLLV